MKSLKEKDNFIELRAQGLSYSKISKKLGISKQTALNWAHELRVDILNHRALELDCLREKYLLSAQAKYMILGEQIEKVRKELSGRKFSDIPTDKLFHILTKLLELAGKNQETLTFTFDRGVELDYKYINEESLA